MRVGVRVWPFGVAATCLAGAAIALLLALDVGAWEDRLRSEDGELERTPIAARWSAETLVPTDPARRLLGLGDDLALRSAMRAYLIAERTPRGFDLGERRTRARSAAEVLLTDVAAAGSRRNASLAENLFGVLVYRSGAAARGVPADDRSVAAFEAAARLVPNNEDAKFNLELLLQRARTRGEREGPGAGSGSRGPGRRGAGSGTPGRGY